MDGGMAIASRDCRLASLVIFGMSKARQYCLIVDAIGNPEMRVASAAAQESENISTTLL
jgi:hypothetical protein